jgi:hypothetical protein
VPVADETGRWGARRRSWRHAPDRDHIELGVGPDANHRHGFSALFTVRRGGSYLWFEDLGVEGTQSVDVVGYQRDVVDPV